MSEIFPDPSPESLVFNEQELNDINLGLFRYLWKISKSYAPVRRLLGKGIVELSDSEAGISTNDWEFFFKRNSPDYLDLTIIKRPTADNKDSMLVEDRVDLVYLKEPQRGRMPLVQHDITEIGKLKLPPERNNSTAIKGVAAFISDIEGRI